MEGALIHRIQPILKMLSLGYRQAQGNHGYEWNKQHFFPILPFKDEENEKENESRQYEESHLGSTENENGNGTDPDEDINPLTPFTGLQPS